MYLPSVIESFPRIITVAPVYQSRHQNACCRAPHAAEIFLSVLPRGPIIKPIKLCSGHPSICDKASTRTSIASMHTNSVKMIFFSNLSFDGPRQPCAHPTREAALCTPTREALHPLLPSDFIIPRSFVLAHCVTPLLFSHQLFVSLPLPLSCCCVPLTSGCLRLIAAQGPCAHLPTFCAPSDVSC